MLCMNVNFELYKVFYVVATNKSISKGAEVLLISQPAVSQAIHNLEGIRLESAEFEYDGYPQ